MKKIVFILFFGIFIFSNGFAQDSFKFGVNGGLTYSSFRGNPQIEMFNADFDFLAGVSFEYQLKERLSLVANINYDRKSVNDEPYLDVENAGDPIFSGKVKVKFKNQFISLPIMLKYKFNNSKSFYINGGPFLSYLLKSEFTNNYDNVNSDYTDNMKSVDFGLIFGIGKIFKLKNNSEINIEIRENLGLSNISALPVVGDGSIKSNSINLICNYSFKL